MNLINSIFEGISIALYEEFGDAKVYPENLKQGFEAPCFFVQCINPTHELFLGRKDAKSRYFRSNQFCIQYFPKDLQRAREEIHTVAEQMEWCLEWIIVDGDLVRGTDMHYEINDDVLSFFVNYDMFIMVDVETDEFGSIEINQRVEER